MTEAMIDRLRELLRAATPGEWHAHGCEITLGVTGHDVYQPDDPDSNFYCDAAGRIYNEGGHTEADAALIVELRNNAAALLDAHDRMAARITRLERFAADTGAWAEAADETNEADVGDGIPARRFDFAGVIEAARAALAVPKEENPDV